MKNATALPVLSYSTGGGWLTVGHARSEAGAAAVIRKVLGDESSSLLKQHGFKLTVKERTDLQVDLNGGPKGYVWSLGKAVNTQGA